MEIRAHPINCFCEHCDAYSPLHFALDEIADAARLAKCCADNRVLLVRGVVYGAQGRRDMVTLASHTQILAELADAKVQLAALDAASDRDDEPEFGADMIEAGDR